MKKILCLVAVLSLIAGTAFAADLNDGLTKQVWNQTKGRSVVSDGSVALRVWYVGSATPTIGISAGTVELYEDGVVTEVATSSYDTAKELAEYIDSLDNWEAAVGPDVRPGKGLDSSFQKLLPVTTAAAGTSLASPTNIYLDTSTSRQLWAGIEATPGKYNRLKSIDVTQGITASNGIVTILIYDGDTVVWRRDIRATPWNTATSKSSSPCSVTFVNNADKGLASSLGKSLTVCVSSSTAILSTAGDSSNGAVSDKLTDHNISILYDQF